jgi:hypothetical protein
MTRLGMETRYTGRSELAGDGTALCCVVLYCCIVAIVAIVLLGRRKNNIPLCTAIRVVQSTRPKCMGHDCACA